MDEYDLPYPDEEDNFEDQYADELEVLNDIGGDGPSSRKSLNFDAHPVKALDSSSQDASIDSIKNSAKSKKRSSEDMYGSIPDVDDDDDYDYTVKTLPDLVMDVPSPLKKRKRQLSPESKDHQDLNGNTSPIEHSKLRKNMHVSPFKSQTYLDKQSPITNSQPQTIRQYNGSQHPSVYTRPPMGKETVTITRTDGQRLYLELRDQSSDESPKNNKQFKSHQDSLQLLQMPFSSLKQQVDEERRRKMTEESDRIAASLRRALQGDSDTDNMDTDEAVMEQEVPEPPQHSLWVEKYSPRLFTELLSDDAINRTLLKWLKLWDKVVFNKTKDPDRKQNAQQKKEKENVKGPKKFGSFNKGIENEEWLEVDTNGYPVRKVALLCGPPGLGKTTLAHVIARHAGYNVVEMNASDDRTADVFKQKIETSTQMKSVLGKDERPNCLVIDEIDGAPTPAINVLLSIMKKKESDANKNKKKNKVPPLSRPIICICNDQFVPSLRQLRQLALVAVFPKTIPGRLSVRLLDISKRESVKTDMTTLLALCDKADNDIRSCLNTLQFVHKRHGRLSLDYVQSADIGQKDLHKNLFTIMQEVFRLPKPKRKRFAGFNDNMRRNDANGGLRSEPGIGGVPGIGGESGFQGQTVSALTSRFHNVLRSVSSCGQYEKLTQGLFENYLNIKFKDSGFKSIVSGTEWLEFSDFIEQQINSSQQYILRRYSPFLAVSFHLLYATPASSKLSYPSTQYECYLKRVKTSNLITTMKSEASPRIRRFMDERIACTELFPLLLEILTPNMRPVNMQLFSSREKQQLAELIDTMIAYNLTYHQERNYEGQYSYVLDPNVEEVVKFPTLPQHKQLTYATKQLIAREIELEKMRRAEKMTHARNENAGQGSIPAKKAAKDNKPVTVLKPDTSKIKIKAPEKRVALDFFGQPIKPKTYSSSQEGSNPDHNPKENSSQVIWFKFNEGYSNAVRKNVKIQDFL